MIPRPDICKAIPKLSEFLQNPSPEHIGAADRALQYLLESLYLSVQYNGNRDCDQQIFSSSSDSAFADDQATRKSSYGFRFILYGGPIYYKAIKGMTVTTSLTEAELLAISLTATSSRRSWIF